MIDYQKRIADQENALEQLLAKRKAGISSGIDTTRKEIEQDRANAFGPVLQSKLSSLGVTTPVNTNTATSKLDMGLDEILGNQQYSQKRERFNLAYNRALDRAINAGMNRREAENFARQVQQDEIRRQNEAQMNEKQRQQAIRKQGMENSAFAREQDMRLSSMPDPMAEYEQAMIRIMTGMPIQLMTYYGLSGGFGGGTQSGIGTTPKVAGVGLGGNNPYYDPYNPTTMSKLGGRTAGTGGF